MHSASLIPDTMEASLHPINRRKRARAMRAAHIGQRTRKRRKSPIRHSCCFPGRSIGALWSSRPCPSTHRPTIAAPDDDPYLWLEEIEGERALAFVEQQNALTLQKFGDAGFAGDRDALADILDRPDNIPFISRRGAFVYNLWKDANNPRGLWRRTTLAEFRKPNPAWETILDIDRLAAEENEDWLFAGTQALPGSGARIVSLSRGGSDAAVLREFDIDTKAFVTGGFTLPEAKGGVAWIDADTLLLSSAYGEGMATTSGYARTVRLWRRGTDVRQAPVLIETTPEHMSVHGQRRPHRRGAADMVHRAARFLQPQYMAWRRGRRARETRSADRRR